MVVQKKVYPEFRFIEKYFQYRLESYSNGKRTIAEPKIPSLNKWSVYVPDSIKNANLNKAEMTLLLLALSPHVKADLLDSVIQKKSVSKGDFSQLGGVRGEGSKEFLPTGETALFLLAGENLKMRQKIYEYFGPNHFFAKNHILWLENSRDGDSKMSGKLRLSPKYVKLFLLEEFTKRPLLKWHMNPSGFKDEILKEPTLYSKEKALKDEIENPEISNFIITNQKAISWDTTVNDVVTLTGENLYRENAAAEAAWETIKNAAQNLRNYSYEKQDKANFKLLLHAKDGVVAESEIIDSGSFDPNTTINLCVESFAIGGVKPEFSTINEAYGFQIPGKNSFPTFESFHLYNNQETAIANLQRAYKLGVSKRNYQEYENAENSFGFRLQLNAAVVLAQPTITYETNKDRTRALNTALRFFKKEEPPVSLQKQARTYTESLPEKFKKIIPNNKTLRVYSTETPKLPPSVTQVETAIPVFIGYTEKAIDGGGDSLLMEPKRINSLMEYERFFGFPFEETNLKVTIKGNAANPSSIVASIENPSSYKMYYGLQMYFANGGGACWIVSVGGYTRTKSQIGELRNGLDNTEIIDEITLYVYPDVQGLSSADDFYNLFGKTLDMCAKLKDRFAVMDIWPDPEETDPIANVELMRNNTSSVERILKYGATYFPNLETILDYYYGDEDDDGTNVTIDHQGGDDSLNGTLAELKSVNNALYIQAQQVIRNIPLIMPPSPGVVGVYAQVDDSRGVWKAPANVNMNYVIKPVINITNEQQEGLNIDANAGKSVNAIRSFEGRGNALIWGARTLAGNSNEWRYISVRRFFNMVEESTKRASEQFVFEPNDANTWVKVRAMIENFLMFQWKAGALAGAKPEHAFYVRIGLGQTMSALDILEGKMIIEIGMAVVRPAEFIILNFSQKMMKA